MKRILALSAVMAALVVAGIPAAHAAVIEISIDTVVYADEGSTTLLTTVDTPAELIGESCVAYAEAQNQSSVHPGNDLIISSGGSSTVLSDVERAPDAVTRKTEPVVLGDTISVSVRMGPDETFSGGFVLTVGDCTPPTTTTAPALPVIDIEKTATPDRYGTDGIGRFTIEVTNTGPVDLTNVRVTDDVAVAIDPDSNCADDGLPDLAVGESFTYECAVANLDGVSPFTNEATAIGIGPDGTEVTDTDDATVFPPDLATTITQPPTTATVPPTLPNTGVPFEQVRGFGIAGFGFMAAGMALLAAAALVGHRRIVDAEGSLMGYREIWLRITDRPEEYTIYLPLRRTDRD